MTRSATYLGAKDFQPLANDFNIELGYLYRSPAILSEDDDRAEASEDPRESFGRPGSRAPHLWLETGRPADLDARPVRPTGSCCSPRGRRRLGPKPRARLRADIKGLTLDTHVVGGGDAVSTLQRPIRDRAYGLSDRGAVLVRPDGFVAWRAKAMATDPARTMATALRAILMR